MFAMSNTATRALVMICCAAALVGCGQKGLYKKGIKQADLIVLKYPQSAYRAGALGWGNAKGVPESLRPAHQNFAPELLAKIPKADAAWFGKSKEYSQYINALATPGTSGEILRELRIADGNASLSLEREGIKYVDYGDLVEENVDLQRLSNSIVRGWYNMDGETMTFDALAAFRPDKDEFKGRPWLVRRSVSSKGLKYEVSQELGAAIAAKAEAQIYMSGTVGAGFRVTNGTTLVIDKPMVIGYDTAELIKIEPPMPMLVSGISPEDMRTHTFTWRLRESGDKRVVEVDPYLLRTQEKREMAEESYTPAVVQEFMDSVKTGKPVGVSVFAEAKHSKGGDWRLVSDNGAFNSNELLRLNVNLSQPGYLYILSKDQAGQAVVVYPKVEGEPLSIGEDKLLPAGRFEFPGSVIKEEGMTFENLPTGLESFIIIATAEKSPSISKSMAMFAAEARKKAVAGGAKPIIFPNKTRVVGGYGSVPTSNTNTKVELPVFVSPDGATLFTLNLTRNRI